MIICKCQPRTVKAELYRLHGWSRFRQRLLHDGCVLENTDSLDGRVDVQMLLVDFASTSWHQADSLTKAVTSGNVGLVSQILDRPQNPNFVDTQGRKPLGLALRCGHIGSWVLVIKKNVQCLISGFEICKSPLAGSGLHCNC